MTTISASREPTVSSSRVRLGAVSLALSGILFVLYPLLRPYSDETSLQGAAAFASPLWIVAHLLGVMGFIFVALGLLALSSVLQHTVARRLASPALILAWLGVGFILPYYGAEMFGLRALGQEALRQHSPALLSLADAIRLGPGAIVFGVGLLLLAVGAILVAIAIWRSGTLSRWSGLPFALGFVLYLPQFFGTPPVRVVHGFLVALGCLWIAWGMLKGQRLPSQFLPGQASESSKHMRDKDAHQISV
ncbi:MAG: hypothetical protein JOZ18_20010 [Chloroflexi bacterium]|nr:hypothetical protein [Chloroflexota bacterium]